MPQLLAIRVHKKAYGTTPAYWQIMAMGSPTKRVLNKYCSSEEPLSAKDYAIALMYFQQYNGVALSITPNPAEPVDYRARLDEVIDYLTQQGLDTL